ncbi:DUF1996 domain-containing protein [Planomonospora sp. ID67723]|uniref:DUF1996 domain-containing protein n=1 Tax=Planomonospora sp. ID67723 TaxID=2738134 RepID=UPI0018C353FA|nr:DUF1996 domain-containing protein [Planomonospora sp. ID67723]MBG0829151.1 DUF1996 domain-containing protein [Planomonospora sp. ID67723]
MKRVKRLYAPLSALVLAAGVLTAVAGPAEADHCDPAEQGQNQQGQDQQGQDQQGQDQQGQDQQGQNQGNPQGPDQQDQQGQDQQGQDQQGQDQQDQDQQDQNQQDQNQNQGNPQGPDQQDQRSQGNPQGPDQQDQRSQNPQEPDQQGEQAEEECADLGPFPQDFTDIRQVQPNVRVPRPQRGGSTGSFVSRCGRNQNGHRNPDNFIVAPGVRNGAHHVHDYVGNLSTDAFSTDQSLAASGTTCAFGDRSTYFWPVLRDRTVDANNQDPDGNVGQILTPRVASMQFRGNPVAKVTAMPRFLRMITGDAKAATNGGGNARAQWTCSGFTNRVLTDKYPICPRGSLVVRILDFPSCWDGQNTDSANHRTHVLFPDENGACPAGTRPVPQLRMTLAYATPRTPSFALDAFPEQLHNPVTDHADFANVMPDRLMRFAVNCINQGRRC